MRKKVLLFAMTGFGNSALKALAESASCEVAALFTSRRAESPFPYYDCPPLREEASRRAIPVYEGVDLRSEKGLGLASSFSPHLIIVASYNRIVPREVIQIPSRGVVNIHPSLLPRYRGATPTFWALARGEEHTGVTAHFIEDEHVDRGRIILQRSLAILPGDTEGSLRERLASLSEEVVKGVLEAVFTRKREEFPLQDEAQATSFPKRTEQDGELCLEWPFRDIRNRIRASTPYPGPYVVLEGKKYHVKGAALLSGEEVLPEGGECFVAPGRDGRILFTPGEPLDQREKTAKEQKDG
ncbi:MAG: methionyl-tRNA formyltransferase [Candidatus Eremiobacteraeota bacterium]|nr:methionyl-tRNA formyltransferase [Candidatus Eremiobacteraeota bacterium]